MPPNPHTLKPFTKNDPRINRNGRPKSFDALRKLAQQIAHEVAKVNGVEVVIDGHKVTVAEAILRQWATSSDARLQQAFMEYAFGKPPQTTNVQLDASAITAKLVDYRAGITEAEE